MMKDFAATMQKFYEVAGQQDGDSTWAWTWLRGELVSVDTQQSLSGTGLIRWFVPQSKLSKTLNYLESKSISREHGFVLVNALIESVAYDGAIELPNGVDASDPIFAPKEVLKKIYRAGKRPSNSAIAWTSSAAQGNKRTSMIERGLEIDRISATQILNGIWESLLEDDVFNDEGAGLKTLANKIWRIETLNSLSKVRTIVHYVESIPGGHCQMEFVFRRIAKD